MRIAVPLLCFFLLVIGGGVLWVQQYGMGDGEPNAAERAQSLENALQGVEWYTNESVNKALRAEVEGDLANARLFGDKAIESDLKAQGLRKDTAAAWQAAGRPERARAAWRRAAEMAAARARMLSDRIPLLQKQWETAKSSGDAASQEAGILYVLSLIYTAEQWELVLQFATEASDTDQIKAGTEALRTVLDAIKRTELLDALSHEPRLAGSTEKYHRWQQQVAAAR